MPGAEFLNAFSGNSGEDILGPKYRYHTKIKNPKELGMSSEGSMSALSKDVSGLISYVEILVGGAGNANKAGKPLGDKFFLKTASKCKDVKTKKEVARYYYVDNQIDGSIPGLTALTGFKSGMKGLVIGAMADTFSINPLGLLKGFTEGAKPWCKAVKKKIINDKSEEFYETHHIALSDLKDSELTTSDRAKLSKFTEDMKNNNKDGQCDESFTNIKDIKKIFTESDPIPKTYVLSVSLLLIYILYKLMRRR